MYRYLYLGLASLTTLGALALTLVRPDLRRPIVIVGMVGAAWGPISEHWFLADYWHPPSVLGNPWVEDILFGFGLAGTAAGVFAVAGRRAIARRPDTSARVMTTAFFPVLYIALTAGLHALFNVNSIVVSMSFLAVAGAYMSLRRPDLAIGSLTTAGVLAGLALAGYAVGLDVIVDGHHVLQQIWLLSGKALGITILGNVPLMEVLWWAGWGAFFGVVYEFATGTALSPRWLRSSGAKACGWCRFMQEHATTRPGVVSTLMRLRALTLYYLFEPRMRYTIAATHRPHPRGRSSCQWLIRLRRPEL
jgi:hypothetical protein